MSIQAVLEVDLRAWLKSDKVVSADGAVASWVNPHHPGYPYPEIAGYLLSLLANEGAQTVDLRNRVAGHLADDELESGGVGRDGVAYVFDSAMVLAGMVRHEAAGGWHADAEMISRLFGFILTTLEQRRGIVGDPGVDPGHWSASYGCHLLKTVIAICAHDGAELHPRSRLLIETLLDDLLPLHVGGRFHVNAESRDTYMHAACYAVEGLLTVDGRGIAPVRSIIEESADWLASVQLENGGMPSAHDGSMATAEAHSDCTAQAIRIWACVDKRRFREPITQGVGFLNRMVSDGGVRYRAGSADINTWATIFATQAMEWARTGGDWRWIV